jgi:DNA-binding PadR family transcriptional regulator
MSDKLLKDFYLGFIRIHILYHANQSEVYGAELMKELSSHGFSIGPGTLYPTLHALEEKGYLISERRVESGRTRRYYRITASGGGALAQATKYAKELVLEIQEE